MVMAATSTTFSTVTGLLLKDTSSTTTRQQYPSSSLLSHPPQSQPTTGRRAFFLKTTAAAVSAVTAASSTTSGVAVAADAPPPSPPLSGGKAPDFELPNSRGSGQITTLDALTKTGKWTVLYFYPGAFSSGCTLEARGFQKDLDEYRKLNAQIVGVSVDPVEKNAQFCKYLIKCTKKRTLQHSSSIRTKQNKF